MNMTRSELMAADSGLSTKARNWAYQNMDYLNKPMRLLGSSVKVRKGAHERETYILYLQPADKVAKDTLCPAAASAGCEQPCLISSGQLGMSTGQRAATKRTIWLLLRPVEFKRQLLHEIDKAERRAARTGVQALFRLNGTSDLDWADVIRERPQSEFYDYTKVLSRVRKNQLDNYHLTFSGSMYSPQSKAALRKAVERGHNVAVAYNTKGLASDTVVIRSDLADFDATDLRPLDQSGTIGALSRKGSNKRERAAEGYASFFVTEANEHEFNDLIAVAR